jgi:hypothetical protein
MRKVEEEQIGARRESFCVETDHRCLRNFFLCQQLHSWRRCEALNLYLAILMQWKSGLVKIMN